MREIRTAEDVETIRQTVEEMAEDLATRPREPIDWHDFLYRLEEAADVDLGSSMDSPAIRKIQGIVRTVLQESQ